MLAASALDIVTSSGFQVSSMEETPYSTNFYVQPTDTKEKFISVFRGLKGTGYLPVLRRRGDEIVLSIVRADVQAQSKNDRLLILGSLALTAITIGADFAIRFPMISEIEAAAGVNTSFVASFVTYVAGFLLVLGLHEIGHKLASTSSDVQTSGPYFIPGIPGVYPTLGAVILQRGIPKNRDDLANIGLSGPLLGFLAALVLGAVAIITAVEVPLDEALSVSQQTGVPLSGMQPALELLAMFLRKGNGVLFMGALGTPVWLAFALTFVNLFPAGQLDGGHVARAALGQQGYTIVTVVSIIALFAAGFWLMGILALLTWGFRDHPGPLDDVSGLSLSTKVMVAITALVFLLCFTGF